MSHLNQASDDITCTLPPLLHIRLAHCPLLTSLPTGSGNNTSPGMLAFTEPCLGIMCACLPAMWSLFRGMSGGRFNVFSHFSRGSSGSGGKRSKSGVNTSANSWPRHRNNLQSDDRLAAATDEKKPQDSVLDASSSDDATTNVPLTSYNPSRPAGAQTQKDWLPLEADSSTNFKNEIYHGLNHEGDGLVRPENRIVVKNDVEWTASPRKD